MTTVSAGVVASSSASLRGRPNETSRRSRPGLAPPVAVQASVAASRQEIAAPASALARRSVEGEGPPRRRDSSGASMLCQPWLFSHCRVHQRAGVAQQPDHVRRRPVPARLRPASRWRPAPPPAPESAGAAQPPQPLQDRLGLRPARSPHPGPRRPRPAPRPRRPVDDYEAQVLEILAHLGNGFPDSHALDGLHPAGSIPTRPDV